MALFLNLYLGHLIADYALQPGMLVRAKREGLGGLFLHVGVIGAATALVMWDHTAYFWPIIVLAMGAHFVIEKLTIAARIKTPTRGLFVFVFDQTLHILSIVLLVWLTAGWGLTERGRILWVEVSASQLAVVDALVTVTLLGSILAFEAAGAFVGDESHETTILRWDRARVLGMLERGGAFGLALLAPNFALAGAALVAPFIPRTALALAKLNRREKVRQLVEGATGLALCALCLAGVMAVVSLATM